MITIGSLFSGIGGFELGLERAIPNSKTIWQVEQNKYCQAILKKHWPEAIIHNDIREVNHENVHPVNIICGGFPCQDISAAGKGAGIEHGTRSSLWGEMYRLIDELRPRIAVMENVSALLWKARGMHVVMSNLAQIGYNAEWTVISARQFGAPHLRKRVFIVAYPNSKTRKATMESINRSENGQKNRGGAAVFNRGCNILSLESKNTNQINTIGKFRIVEKEKRKTSKEIQHKTKHSNESWNSNPIDDGTRCESTNANHQHIKEQSMHTISMESKRLFECGSGENERIRKRNYWQRTPIESPLCRMDDGISNRVDRIKALGNAIVPQCSEYIGQCIVDSGLLNDLY